MDATLISLLEQELDTMQLKLGLTVQIRLKLDKGEEGVKHAQPYLRNTAITVLNTHEIRDALDSSYAAIERRVSTVPCIPGIPDRHL